MPSELALLEAASKLASGDVPSAFTTTTTVMWTVLQPVESWVWRGQTLSVSYKAAPLTSPLLMLCVVTILSTHFGKVCKIWVGSQEKHV